MKVEEVSIHTCKNGDILASDIFNFNGVPLVSKDTPLNDYVKGHLIALGINNVRIYQPTGNMNNSVISYRRLKKSYCNFVLQTKSILQELFSGKPLDFEKISSLSDQIGQNINENENIIRCLSEIRGADEYTYTHCVNVAFYSMLIAKWMKLSENEISKAIQSGLLHDIGKTKIPDEILNKGSILTKEEYEVMKRHTILGYEIIKEINDIDDDVKDAVLLHHERMDGSGYPLNSSGDSINLLARIVAVADVFDAMTSDRVYKKRSTPFEAFEMFYTVGMSMFDTDVINVFLKKMAVFLVGANVQLSNGETGEIVFIPLQCINHPIIKTSSDYLDLSQDSIKVLSMI